MTDNIGRRRNVVSDPTAERTSDPVPVGDDVLHRAEPARAEQGAGQCAHETPRRYDQPVESDPVVPGSGAPDVDLP